MPKSWTDEAIVLRTYNVGETDRFCILLTKSRGRLPVRAAGVRRLTSRRAGGLLPLHRVSVTCEAHSFGTLITAASCIDAHSGSWCDPQAFSAAERGVELLLKLTDDGSELDEIFLLTCDFLSACHGPAAAHVADLFTLKLLMLLGTFPSVGHSSLTDRPLLETDTIVFSLRTGGFAALHEDPTGLRLSLPLARLLADVSDMSLLCPPACPTEVRTELSRFVQRLLGSQLGVSLAVPGVSLAMSSGVTPIW